MCQPQLNTDKSIAHQVVSLQIDAYNANDIDAFAATYTEDVEIYDLPAGTLRFSGNDNLKTRYTATFALHPHARIAQRIVEGNKVIDHEFYLRDGMTEEGSVVAIYEVDEEKRQIAKVWFLK